MEAIELGFSELGLKVLDWQKADPSVGIPDGYIIYKDENGNTFEIDFDEAKFFILKKDKNKIILNSIKSDYKEDSKKEEVKKIEDNKPFSLGDSVVTIYNYRGIEEGTFGKIEALRNDNALIEFIIDGETLIKKVPYVYLEAYTPKSKEQPKVTLEKKTIIEPKDYSINKDTTFKEYIKIRDYYTKIADKFSNELQSFPKGNMGLVPSEIRNTEKYKIAKYNYNKAFQKQRDINAFGNKKWKKALNDYAMAKRFKKHETFLESYIEPKPKKRTNAYNWVFDRITNVIAPDLLSQLEKAEYVSDVNGKSQHDADKSGIMYLSIQGIEKDFKGRFVISLAHYYEQNGDLMSDPYMTIRLDTELGTGEALSFQMDGVVGNRTQNVYGITPEGKEGVNLSQKKSQNQFLNKWTKNLVNQNHIVTFNELPEKEEIELSDIDDKFDLAKGKMYAKVFDDNYETIEWSVKQLSDSTAIARQDLKVKLMGADGSKATINLSRGLNIEDYTPPLFELAKEVVGIIKKFASIKDDKSIVLSKTSLGNNIYNYSIDELNKYNNYTAKDLYDIKSYFIISLDRLKQAKGVNNSFDGDNYISKLDDMIESKMDEEGSVNPEIPPTSNLEKQKEKYPIVLEWSEGFGDEHIGFKNIEELEAKLKTIKYIPTDGTYVKNKVWFNIVPHYVRIDIGDENEGNYNPKNQSLMNWLESYDNTGNYEFYKLEKDYYENNKHKNNELETVDYTQYLGKGLIPALGVKAFKPEQGNIWFIQYTPKNYFNPFNKSLKEQKAKYKKALELGFKVKDFKAGKYGTAYILTKGNEALTKNGFESISISNSEIIKAQKEGITTIELAEEKEPISKEAQKVVRGEWDKMKDFLELEPDNKKEIPKVKSAKKYKSSTLSDAFDFVRNIQTYSYEVLFENGKSWYGNALNRKDAIKNALEDKFDIKESNKEEVNNKYFKGLDYDYVNQFKLNKAIEEFLDSKVSDYVFNDLEKQFIYSYAGYGGLEKQGAKGKGLLWEYYTPKLLVEKMWGLAYKYGFNSGKVLEPSVGVGNFINYASVDYDQVTAYEISKYSARICKIVHPKTNIIESSFAEHFYNGNVYNPNYEKDFDLVIGNPPYGKNVDKRAVAESKRIGVSIAQFEHYFILRGLDCLKPGGLLVYVSTANLFTKGYEKIKTKISERAELVDGYLLPNKTFKTTEIGTSIIVLRKK